MPDLRTIEIDFDVHKIIELERSSFSETPRSSFSTSFICCSTVWCSVDAFRSLYCSMCSLAKLSTALRFASRSGLGGSGILLKLFSRGVLMAIA